MRNGRFVGSGRAWDYGDGKWEVCGCRQAGNWDFTPGGAAPILRIPIAVVMFFYRILLYCMESARGCQTRGWGMSSRVVEILTISPRSVNTRTPEHLIAIRKWKRVGNHVMCYTSRAGNHVEMMRHSFCCLQSKKTILKFSLVTRLCTSPRSHLQHQ